MSLRSALSQLAPARRAFTTSALRRAAAPTPAAPAATDAFADLARITATPNPDAAASSSSASSSSAFAQPKETKYELNRRGYTPNFLPPKVEPVVDLFTKLLMRDGKRANADARVSAILAQIQQTANQPPVPLLRRAIELSAPSVRILNKKVTAMKVVQVPKPLNERQRWHAGIKNLFKAAERGKRTGVRFNDRLAREVFAVLEGTSDVYKRVEEVHRQGMLGRSNLRK
ncbi:37S ribosomal protein S7, mitochondrial [Vanrija pseudolonga]|uniref:37S ribosomal protein S7, mitochondrial n=1 Tax=Vanrija pseudolonga TaxID=143232 RepID=A0AAF1BTU1_9TREE|nr:37S ribosomal protein S7, mitochondrial [Vanrija pseudolonga]